MEPRHLRRVEADQGVVAEVQFAQVGQVGEGSGLDDADVVLPQFEFFQVGQIRQDAGGEAGEATPGQIQLLGGGREAVRPDVLEGGDEELVVAHHLDGRVPSRHRVLRELRDVAHGAGVGGLRGLSLLGPVLAPPVRGGVVRPRAHRQRSAQQPYPEGGGGGSGRGGPWRGRPGAAHTRLHGQGALRESLPIVTVELISKIP